MFAFLESTTSRPSFKFYTGAVHKVKFNLDARKSPKKYILEKNFLRKNDRHCNISNKGFIEVLSTFWNMKNKIAAGREI